MKFVAVVTVGLLSKTRTSPPCSTTNQRLLSPGACSIATGLVNVIPENTGSTSTIGVVGGSGMGGVGMPPPLNDESPPHAHRRSVPPESAIQRLRRKLVIGRSSCNVRGISILAQDWRDENAVSVGIVRQARWR